MPDQYKAAVIGAGMMGAMLDVQHAASISNGRNKPQSHAAGYTWHPRFQLVGLCDQHPQAGLAAWGAPIFEDLENMIGQVKPQVYSVALPKSMQPKILRQLLKHKPLAVIAEKPLAPSLEEAVEIVTLYEQQKVPLLVNYTRRYSQIFQKLAHKIQSQEIRVINTIIKYGKGLLHNGSHALDLGLMLFGNFIEKEIQPLYHIFDYWDDDPSITCFLAFEYCNQFLLQAHEDPHFTLFEVDLLMEDRRYVVTNDHRDLHIWQKRENVGIPKGQRLIYEKKITTDYESCMENLMSNLANVCDGVAEPVCSGRVALETHRLFDHVRTKWETKYRV
ncbi:MAG: Gfo/Idh/MocA family oxidoreductase [Alphaproteobacteria bacterium]|nr:Gfo/Idh/MocA family oxidoreductase [Alphaproteobacteria bacterium]